MTSEHTSDLQTFGAEGVLVETDLSGCFIAAARADHPVLAELPEVLALKGLGGTEDPAGTGAGDWNLMYDGDDVGLGRVGC